MRKFKHKKLGTILNECVNGKSYYSDSFAGCFIPKELVENSADWEEVVEKEYEILSFVCDLGYIKVDLTRNKDGFYGIYNVEEKVLINSNLHHIHSVKRLSDGEIFTIGDLTTKGVISKFEFIGDVFSVSVGDQKTLLRTFDKVKQPLFVTEDGVSIFLGDRFQAVQKSTFNLLADCQFDLDNKDWITFSTKEKAEEYILKNKPCLSIADVFKVLKTVRVGEDCFKIKLEQFAKSKIQ